MFRCATRLCVRFAFGTLGVITTQGSTGSFRFDVLPNAETHSVFSGVVKYQDSVLVYRFCLQDLCGFIRRRPPRISPRSLEKALLSAKVVGLLCERFGLVILGLAHCPIW